jgi:2'-5' RNA ligase
MRVFVALEIPEEVRRALGECIARLAAVRGGARWVRPASLHVTLKFIGEAPPEQVERIRNALEAVRVESPVEMKFRGTGFFPGAKHPRVFWAGIEASPNLAVLAAQIEERLAPLGIPRESRAFHPHLTLARFNDERGLRELQAEIARLGPLEFGASRNLEFALFESRLKPGGAEYFRLAVFPIAGPPPARSNVR